MIWQALAVGTVVTAAMAVAATGRWRWPWLGGALVAGVVAAAIAGWWLGRVEPVEPGPTPTTLTRSDGEWTTSRSCRACHPAEYATWHQSYHRTMTQPASAATIVAPWEATLENNGRTYRVFQDDDRFMVDVPKAGTTGDDPADRETLPVVMVTGSHHLQLFWVPLPWAGSEPLGQAERAYRRQCGGCHVEGPESVELRERGLTPPQIRAAMDSAAHDGLTLPPAESARIRRYVERIQLRGRLQQFPFGWFIRDQRWVHEDDTFLQPPPDPQPTEPWEQTWSEACDQCHSVHPEAAWAGDGAPTQASVTELGIACEACHGPAAEHADTMRNPATRYLARLGEDPAPHMVNPMRLDPERATAVCAQCHGEVVRMQDHGVPFPVGEPLEPWGRMVPHTQPPFPDWLQATMDADPLLMSSAFWRDGTMRVAGRDANAMLASACATRGELTCITCHQMHGGSRDDQLAPGARGDAICADCHPAIAAAGSQHTHHPVESEGSRCMNCHMPHTTLGLLTAMRAHRIDSPSAMRTHTTGRPDACTLCHIDRPVSWAARAMGEWYGHEVPDVGGDERSAAVDGLLRGDGAQRAVFAWHLGWGPALEAGGGDWVAGPLSRALDDPYSGVRAIAGRSLRSLPGYEDVDYDFTAPAPQRQRVMQAVLARWEAGQPAPRSSVLVGEDGLDLDLVGLLQLVRDDRPVVVSE